MNRFLKRISGWLLPTVLVLFILEVATLPLVISLTYSGRSESPDRVITYTQNLLRWDSSTAIQPSGTAELSLFDSYYQNVQASDGANILAPGTEGDNIIRLVNSSANEIGFTVVLYLVKDSESLDIVTTLSGNNFEEPESYALPEGVEPSDVIRAVSGSVEPGRVQDFDINWQWEFAGDEGKDLSDTALGNAAAAGSADDVTIGFYIVVEDNGEIIIPPNPGTADTSMVEIYVIVMLVSGGLLLWLVWLRRQERKGAADDLA